ncbi:unnamed protein product [Gadus morhua 'NCC']
MNFFHAGEPYLRDEVRMIGPDSLPNLALWNLAKSGNTVRNPPPKSLGVASNRPPRAVTTATGRVSKWPVAPVSASPARLAGGDDLNQSSQPGKHELLRGVLGRRSDGIQSPAPFDRPLQVSGGGGK